FDRTRMLAGQPAAMVSFDLFAANSNFGGLLPSDLDGPPPPVGTPNSFVEVKDSVDGWPTDQLHVFQFHVDCATASASTVAGPETSRWATAPPAVRSPRRSATPVAWRAIPWARCRRQRGS